MSGQHRLISGAISQGKLRGKALSDALAADLNKVKQDNDQPKRDKK